MPHSLLKPKLVLIAGGTCSGKTTLAKQLYQSAPDKIALVPNDNYYVTYDPAIHGDLLNLNFDHPDALDTDLLVQHLQQLLAGKSVEIPTYSFQKNSRLPETELIEPKPVIILEGMLVLHFEALRNLADLTIFVQTPDDIRAMRRVVRNIKVFNRELDYVYETYLHNVYPMHQQFVRPSKSFADLVVDGRSSTERARQVILDSVLGR